MDDLSGDLVDSDIAALCNVMQNGRKSGTLVVNGNGVVGRLWFQNGEVTDAQVEQLRGTAAVYHMLRWQQGTFRLNYGAPEGPVMITESTQALLLAGAFHFDAWKRRVEDLPRTPEEAFDLPPAAPVDQAYLDVPLGRFWNPTRR